MLELIRTQNLGSLLMKLSQSNFNLRSPNCYLVRSYLIATVTTNRFLNSIISMTWFHRCGSQPKPTTYIALSACYKEKGSV